MGLKYKTKLRWLTNGSKDFDKDYFCTSLEELKNHKKWLKDKVIGEPKATNFYTVKQLKDMGMIGIYVKDDEINEINKLLGEMAAPIKRLEELFNEGRKRFKR